jgi:hypothetical protein
MEALTTTMDEFELTRRVLGEPDDGAEGLELARSRLLEAIAQAGSPRGRRRRWILPIAAALAVALVATLVVLLPAGPGAAAAELRRLGRIASEQDPLLPGPDQYLLIRSEELRHDGYQSLETGISFAYLKRVSISTWLAPDGSGVRQIEERLSMFASEADRIAWHQAGEPDFRTATIDRFEPGEARLFDVTRLPTDPEAALARLRSGQIADITPGDDQVFVLIGELLAQGNASPAVRATLFEVAARLDGVAFVGTVRDPLGRPGEAVSIAEGARRSRLVFDPSSAQLLAIEEYEVDPGGTERLTTWRAAWPTTIVDRAPTPEG